MCHRRNIGRGIAEALAEAGCDVGINDLDQDDDASNTLERVRGYGRHAAFLEGDISSGKEVGRMMRDFLDQFGQIDILVNNAYSSESSPFLEITEEGWDRTLGVCLKGFFLCSQAAAREMAKTGGGSIVSISSVHARRAWPSDTSYGVAKAGILRLTESMAKELGSLGSRCNAILPGYMDTTHRFGTPAPALGSASEGLQPFIPTRRQGTPEDIGRAVAFLSSPNAANITGASIPVDGGLLVTGVP